MMLTRIQRLRLAAMKAARVRARIKRSREASAPRQNKQASA